MSSISQSKCEQCLEWVEYGDIHNCEREGE
jgi:hypothetical protein